MRIRTLTTKAALVMVLLFAPATVAVAGHQCPSPPSERPETPTGRKIAPGPATVQYGTMFCTNKDG